MNQTSTRIEVTALRDLKYLAKKNHRSMTQMLTYLIQEAMTKDIETSDVAKQ